MAYNKFKIEDVQSKLFLSVIKEDWLNKNLNPFVDDTLLMRVLSEAKKIYLGSEKARSEFIVTPILQALHRQNEDKFSIFSGYEFNIDKNNGLNGFCDFILSSPANGFLVEAPAFFIVETKKTDIDDNAIAQCGAEMYAAKIFNERKKRPQNAIYGCVTSAYSWGFLKLENNLLKIDPNYASLSFDNPYPVLSALQWILEQSLSNS
ncbi:MAG: hypothetical protein EAZ44_08550 [Cytophagia bacterium]|nr:MAG: hypothetical protein EAZ44_08550 [Cytophagia bacterium]TAG40552.1 MAG: hypothetical protein EAZ31_08270 [Cytophagia bacterium]